MSIRFLPKRRASMEVTPGPSMASAAPTTARSTAPRTKGVPEITVQTPRIATITPTTGVHKPTRRKRPAAIATDCRAIRSQRLWPTRWPTPSRIKIAAAATRKRSRARPGQPFGNMENSRCKKNTPRRKATESNERGESPKVRVVAYPFRVGGVRLELDDAALQADGDGVGAVVGIELGQNIFDVGLDGFFGDGEPIGDDFIGVTGGNQAKDFDFARGELVVGGVIGEFGGDFWRDAFVSGMDGADGIEQFAMQQTFQQIRAGAGFESADDLDVTGVGGEGDEARVGKFSADGAHGVDAVHAGHLQIHEHDIGPMQTKLFDGFQAIGSLADELQVGLIGNERGDALAQNRVIVDQGDANWFRSAGHRTPSLFSCAIERIGERRGLGRGGR